MQIIYEPKGKAGEYAALALNYWKTCEHGCRYCYCPIFLPGMKAADFFRPGVPKKNVIARVLHDARLLADAGDDREILLSFIGDPYQPMESALYLTQQIVGILKAYGLRFCVLTKGASRAFRDMDMLEGYDRFRFGVSLAWVDDKKLREWEPSASGFSARLLALKIAHDRGISTFVSVEPVIEPDQALLAIEACAGYVDEIKVGKINHFPEIESRVDWPKFRLQAEGLLKRLGKKYYIKKSLREM